MSKGILPDPKRKYFVLEPQMMISIGEYERMLTHMVQLACLPDASPNQSRVIKKRHARLMKDLRKKLRNAKDYYGIETKISDEGFA